MKKGSVHISCAKTQTLQLWIKYMKSLVTPNLDQLHKIGPLSDSLFLHPRTFPNELPKQLRQVIAFLVAGGDLTQYLSGDAGKCCNWLVYSSSGKTNKHLHIKKIFGWCKYCRILWTRHLMHIAWYCIYCNAHVGFSVCVESLITMQISDYPLQLFIPNWGGGHCRDVPRQFFTEG